MENYEQKKEKTSMEITDDVLEQVSGGISDAEANLENEYIKEETMIIIPLI